jgi:predicted site-specific integrase-resolvase
MVMYTFSSKEELAEWISREVCGVSEAMEILESSRQNIHGFVKNGKLKPVKETKNERLFFRSDLLERKEAAKAYHTKKDKPSE